MPRLKPLRLCKVWKAQHGRQSVHRSVAFRRASGVAAAAGLSCMLHSIAAHQIDNILGQARITNLIATPARGGAQGGVLLLLPDGHCCNGSRQEAEQPTTQRLHSCACQNVYTHARTLCAVPSFVAAGWRRACDRDRPTAPTHPPTALSNNTPSVRPSSL